MRFFFLLVLVASSASAADYMSESEFLKALSEPAGSLQHERAVGYLMGVADTGLDFCFVRPVPMDRLIALATAELISNPTKYDVKASFTIRQAWRKSYPCREVP